MRGGGYNVADRSMCDGGVALDFSLMKDVFLQYPLAHRAPLRQRRHASWGAPSLTITRREALTRLAVLAVGSPVIGSLSREAAFALKETDQTKFPDPLGVQLYTLRTEMERDVAATLARVAEIGYEEVEFAGYFGDSPSEIRRFLADAGLRAPSAHVAPDLVEEAWPATLEAAAAVGHDYVVVPSIPESMRTSLDDWRRTAERLTLAAAEARAAGLQLAYHNHDFEFREMEGRTPLNVFLETADPELVQVELDLFWIVHAGGDPIAFIDRWPGRIPLVHAKGRTADGRMTEVGSGVIDWAEIFQHRERAGIRHYFVEHDRPGKPFQSVESSFRYLSRLETE
jgi:sugar phosphate isomerase/epimerase